ncbi:MAG: hypothetical protein ACI841_002097 [Planctomycetota bacterium]|jgi:hypothetical protein
MLSLRLRWLRWGLILNLGSSTLRPLAAVVQVRQAHTATLFHIRSNSPIA